MSKKGSPCRWCRKPLVELRRTGICQDCTDKRDERNRQITAGEIPYVPPDQRPGHRFFTRKGKPKTDRQIAAIERARVARKKHPKETT